MNLNSFLVGFLLATVLCSHIMTTRFISRSYIRIKPFYFDGNYYVLKPYYKEASHDDLQSFSDRCR